LSDTEQLSLSGIVERITFHNAENGFCILRVNVPGERDTVTVVASLAEINVGESIDCLGDWITNKTYGLQFKAEQINVVLPQNLDGMHKYLASGMIKGIGARYAKRLIKKFGSDVFDIIEHNPERLNEVEGFGAKRIEQVTQAWDEQKSIRDIMVFLQSHGIGANRAVRIFKTYGTDAIKIVNADPYRLALEVNGIGFKTVDALAEELGIAKDAPVRAQAGVRHVLQGLTQHGHCAVQHTELVKQATGLLQIAAPLIEEAITHEVSHSRLIAEDINEQACLFLPQLFYAEQAVAGYLKNLLAEAIPWGELEAESLLPDIERKTGLILSASQTAALITVVKHKISIITGGPGVGKTTIVNTLIKMLQSKRMGVKLCAPTGRAAKRLQETTGLNATTIHRLLEFDPATNGFKHDSDNPLKLDVLIIDEASMLDINLTKSLLSAVPPHAAIVFVGDVDQLPSVGPGQVLADLINSNAIITVHLTEIFRQADSSKIIVNAHQINAGNMPLENDPNGDFFTLYADTPEMIHDKLVELISERIPKRYDCDPIRDIQVLTPMNRGGLGVKALNVALQALLNGNAHPKIERFGQTYATGDKVIQTINNYDKEVFNGDIGVIDRIDEPSSVLWVNYEQRNIAYSFNELDELSLAYATSIHKSQGSEYPIVVMPLSTQHYTLLARNLLYTGVTRGKKLVILIAQKKAVAMAVQRSESQQRLTNLAVRLNG
jgi:exodeoxyribonuclease V alpha subunit